MHFTFVASRNENLFLSLETLILFHKYKIKLHAKNTQYNIMKICIILQGGHPLKNEFYLFIYN